MVALNYNRWDVCHDAVKKGNELRLPVYRFLRDPLVRHFGEDFYQQLCDAAQLIASEVGIEASPSV